MRWFGFADPKGSHAPGAVFVKEHSDAEWLFARRAGDDDLLVDQTVRNAQLLGRVPDTHVDRVLRGTLKSPLLQPDWQPGAAAGRVDNQVGVDGFATVEYHAGHPRTAVEAGPTH